MKNIISIIQKLKSKITSERGEIGDSLMTVIGIGTAVVLMVGIPLITMSQKTDDISTLAVQTEVTEFANKVRTTGNLNEDEYAKFEENIGATGNTYEIEMEIHINDENAGKKVTQAQKDKIGENQKYIIYTSDILNKLTNDKNFKLSEGYEFYVKVRNTNTTLYEQLSGNENPIVAQAGGLVTANGS